MTDSQTHEQPAARSKTCARCGTVFGCRAETGGCWCAAEPVYLPMPPPGSAEDCMCPTCLRAEVAKRQKA
jgi:Cysteine-rich CWC